MRPTTGIKEVKNVVLITNKYRTAVAFRMKLDYNVKDVTKKPLLITKSNVEWKHISLPQLKKDPYALKTKKAKDIESILETRFGGSMNHEYIGDFYRDVLMTAHGDELDDDDSERKITHTSCATA